MSDLQMRLNIARMKFEIWWKRRLTALLRRYNQRRSRKQA